MAKPASNGHGPRGATAVLKSIVVRLYSLVLLLVVIWTGYIAFDYLFELVFSPARVPPRFLEWQGTLDADALDVPDTPGLTAPAVRAPIGHYHGVGHWYQPDPLQTCTTSGCHPMLPHVQNKATRAFANFHVTFLACESCHDDRLSGPVEAGWVNLETGDYGPPPALLRLIRWMNESRETIREEPATAHTAIVPLLEEAIADIGGDPLLEYLRVQIDTSQPGSPVWTDSVDRLFDELPEHMRGEYDAKIAPVDIYTAAYRRDQLVLAEGDDTTEIIDRLHEHVLAKPDACLTCHGPAPGRLDFAELGYLESYAKRLRREPMVRMIQRVREGRPFYLPGMLEEQP